MQVYRCRWCLCPTAHNRTQITFIEADSDEAARAVLQAHVEHHYASDWFKVDSIEPYVRPTGGRVVG